MALWKVKQFDGYDFGYWVIVNATEDKIMNKTTLIFKLYKDEDARNANIHANRDLYVREIVGINYSKPEMYALAKESMPATQSDVDVGMAQNVGDEMNVLFGAIDI